MSRPASIFAEVETALHDASGERRVEVLRRVTDLFVGQAGQINEEQTQLFDGVLSQLIKHIEERAIVAGRVAPIPNAPADTVRALARHDNIEISGPILTQSTRLTDGDLIEIATTKSQEHLACIASRNSDGDDRLTESLAHRADIPPHHFQNLLAQATEAGAPGCCNRPRRTANSRSRTFSRRFPRRWRLSRWQSPATSQRKSWSMRSARTPNCRDR